MKVYELCNAKFGLRKLETSLYRAVHKYFDTLNRLGMNYQCCR